MVEVIAVGTKVELGGGVEGWIAAVTIRQATLDSLGVEYMCNWWAGRELKVMNFSPSEIRPIDSENRLKIGFQR